MWRGERAEFSMIRKNKSRQYLYTYIQMYINICIYICGYIHIYICIGLLKRTIMGSGSFSFWGFGVIKTRCPN